MRSLTLLGSAFLFISTAQASLATPQEPKAPAWHVVTLSFEGPTLSETKSTFFDYRLDVEFTHSTGKMFLVPGYFAASGEAADDGASTGKIWHAKFVPSLDGEWRYKAHFRKGDRIAIGLEEDGESAGFFDGDEGKITVAPAKLDPNALDFRKRGMLLDVKNRYLQFAGTKQYFLKTGAGSPENILAYSEFDGTYDIGGTPFPALGDNQLHEFEPHIKDWREGDPVWGRDGRGKGLIGIANYYAEVGVNAQYMVVMNVGGDGQDVFPWVRHDDMYVFDVSKLAQWERVLSYMDRKGVLKDFLFTEMENESLFEGIEGGEFADSRKLFYREMVARFGHLLGLVWNLGEENGSDAEILTEVLGSEGLAVLGVENGVVIPGNPAWIKATTQAQRLAFAQYIADLDPYDRAIVSHNLPGAEEMTYGEKLGVPTFSGISLQAHEHYADIILEWLNRSKAAGRQWMITVDEPMGWEFGARPDEETPEHEHAINDVLWPSLLAGAAGVDWYFGWQNNAPTSDLSNEDQRSRHNLWVQSAAVRAFWETKVPFWEMEGSITTENGRKILKFSGDPGKHPTLTLSDEGLSFEGVEEPSAVQFPKKKSE